MAATARGAAVNDYSGNYFCQANNAATLEYHSEESSAPLSWANTFSPGSGDFTMAISYSRTETGASGVERYYVVQLMNDGVSQETACIGFDGLSDVRISGETGNFRCRSGELHYFFSLQSMGNYIHILPRGLPVRPAPNIGARVGGGFCEKARSFWFN